MKPLRKLEPEFVEFIPAQVEDGKLYVSMQYGTVVHNCCCGCGNKVVTPLTPTDWKLTYDGEAISLSPSIGNWSFPCQSHYWIRRGNVDWSNQWTPAEVAAGRRRDSKAKQKYYAKSSKIGVEVPQFSNEKQHSRLLFKSWWSKLIRKLRAYFYGSD